MKIALAQINTQVGNLEGNCQSILKSAQEAQRQGASIVLFPELTLTGYPPKDLLERADFIEANLKALQALAPHFKNILGIVGFVDRNSLSSGKGLFNAAAGLTEGKIKFIYHKQLLPTYDVFDERRYFEAGTTSGVWEWQGFKLGISICEDLWGQTIIEGRQLYDHDPLKIQAQEKVDYFLNLSASPYFTKKASLRFETIARKAKLYKRPIAYVNLVGGNDDLIFDGLSGVFNANGEICHPLPSFTEKLQCLDLQDLNASSPAVHDELEWLWQALVTGTRDYLQKTGFKKVILGLSGGIDSALVAALAVEALGYYQVSAVALPSLFSSAASLSDAQELADNLEIKLRTFSIHPLFDTLLHSLGLSLPSPGEKVSLTLQNMQARLRGHILMTLSNEEARLLLATGNKSELAMGYCTLYGDMAGGLAPISDVYKTQVYQLANFLNHRKTIIPQSILNKAPSAELAPHQTDQDDLPPYEVLDEILRRFLDERQSIEHIVNGGFDPKLVQEVIQRLDRSEYKRKQMPLGLKVNPKAFGSGRLFPLSQQQSIF